MRHTSKARSGRVKISTPAGKSAKLRWRLAFIAAATLFCGWGLALLAEADAPLPSSPSKEQQAVPAPAWVAINRPFQLYGLEVPEVAKLSKAYEARRHVTGGGRQDILTFGTPTPDSAYFRLVLYRLGSEEAPNTPFFVELARRAAEGDLAITKSVPPVAMPTRFGDAEVADVTLAAADGAAVPCLGIRMEAKSLPWRITGFACGGPKPLPRPELQCIFDRLDLNTAGEDQALSKFFADAELHRNQSCSGTRLTPTTARATWLDDKDTAPAMKPTKH
jgi:hypothetical protein